MSVTAHRSDVETQVPASRNPSSRASADAGPAVRTSRADGVAESRMAPARVVRRAPAHRPPSRRRVVRAGAPRVVASCAPRRPRLSTGWVLAVASVACAAVVGLGTLAGSVEPPVPSETTVVRVKPGENLWELAGRVAPGADTAAVVERIRELNGVGATVRPGQPLTVPFVG